MFDEAVDAVDVPLGAGQASEREARRVSCTPGADGAERRGVV